MMTAPAGGSLTGIASIEAILRLARQIPVFPCLRCAKQTIINGKPKAIRAKSPHIPQGFLKASQDENEIRAWWKRWPDALVGAPTGELTGLIAIDYDPAKHTQETSEWFTEHTEGLMAARIHTTLRAGKHYLYRVTKGQRYRTGTDLLLAGKIRPGIDLRADGGYIIWWPLHGGEIINETAPLLPAGLIDERAFLAAAEPHQPRDEPSPQAWEKDKTLVMDALAYVEPDTRDAWLRIGLAIHLATGGNDEGFDLWHGWSAGGITGNVPNSYAGLDDCRETWATFRHSHPDERKLATLGTLFHLAKAGGYAFPARPIEEMAEPPPETPPPLVDDEPDAKPDLKDEYRRPMKWAELEEQKPPERIWRIGHWLSTGPTLFAGKGGTGKTLVAQTLATALAIGQNFIDQVDEPMRVLFWACEDDHDELWRRQIAICEYFSIRMRDLADKLILEPRLGLENTLFAPVFGKPSWTPLKDELQSQVEDYRADLLIADNTSQLFGCNENDRHEVTVFMNGLVGLVMSRPFTQLILSHPAKADGSEFSGSTAWENAVRMRWFLGTALPDQEQPEEGEADPNVRYLAKRKTNYSVKDYRKLYFENGVFKIEQTTGAIASRYNFAARTRGAEAAVVYAVNKLNAQSIRVVDSYNSPDYLIRKMQQMKLMQDYTQKELADAMQGLRLQGRLIETKVGSHSNRTAKFGLGTNSAFDAQSGAQK